MFCQAQDQCETNVGGTAVMDKCQFLVSHMEQYYSLALLLTGSEVDAESCFVHALNAWSKACPNLVPIVEEVANQRIKRVVVDCALRVCDPLLCDLPREFALETRGEKLASHRSPWLGAILQLGTFERFVFVLSVLESYSDAECANLLHCRLEDVAESRVQALSSVSAALSYPQFCNA
jgi:hypothetical protein